MSAKSDSLKVERAPPTTAEAKTSDEESDAVRRLRVIGAITRKSKYLGTYKKLRTDIEQKSTEDLERLDQLLNVAVLAHSNPRMAVYDILSVIEKIKGDLAYEIGWNPFVNIVRDAIRKVSSPSQRIRQQLLLRHCRTNKVLMNLLCTILANGGNLTNIERLFARSKSQELLSRAPMAYSWMEVDWICALLQVARNPTLDTGFIESLKDDMVQTDSERDLIQPTIKLLREFYPHQCEFELRATQLLRHPLVAVRVFFLTAVLRRNKGRDQYKAQSLRDYATLLQNEFATLLT